MPLVIPDSIRPATERWTGPMSCGCSRTTITPSSAPKLPLAREKRWLRTGSSSVPPRTSCRPSPTPRAVWVSGSRTSVGEAGLGEIAGETVGVDRLAHDPHADQVRTGRRQGLLDRAVDVAGQIAEGDQADPAPAQPVAHQDRVDPAGELVGPTEFAAQLVGAFARVLEVAGEAVLEVLARVGERVAAELGADQDPDREGEEDRDQRRGVVASAVTHRPGKARRSPQRRTTARARS